MLVHKINAPAEIGKTNESGSNLRIIKYINAPVP